MYYEKIIKIAALLIASLLLFSSCEKADEPIENTWKMTIYETKVPEEVYLYQYLRVGLNDIYFSFSKRSVTISLPLSKMSPEVSMFAPQYRDYFGIVGTGIYTLEKETETSGTIILSRLSINLTPWGDSEIAVFKYRNLTNRTMTLVVPDTNPEITYELSAVKNPQFVTMEEFMSNYGGPE